METGKGQGKKRLAVIGGGAAGFFCAITAARMNPTLEVIIIEKTSKLLSKVRISGGGRCNVTHACHSIPEMSKKYPRGEHFVRKAFHQFFTDDTIQWFLERGVMLKTEEDGRMFPEANTSQAIIDCLVREVNSYGIEIMLNAQVSGISFGKTFHLDMVGRPAIQADFVCIASGGYPKSSMFDWLKNIGHTIVDPVPSLFTFNMPGDEITSLMGVSVPLAKIKIVGTNLQQEGPLLITHWGLSGPAVLKLSAWGARWLYEKSWEFEITVNWVPGMNEQQVHEKLKSLRFERASQKLVSKNAFGLPQRLWDHLLERSISRKDIRWADLTIKDQHLLARNLSSCSFSIKGKTTYKEEFVTAGGVQLSEIDPNTMMSKKVPNLFFAGEVMNVDGITGGFNFQHAWTSGYIAGMKIAMLSAKGQPAD
jgi:predicted Rossmann fold flavoprotein